nr:hypothetical protein [Tanacetum cinerariifolium]
LHSRYGGIISMENHVTSLQTIRASSMSSGPSDAGGNPPPVTIYTWLERFNKQKPHSFEKATAPVDAENWISHMEKIFDVMGCEDAFKTRLAVYKFEGNALAWWKAYKRAKGGDAWLITVANAARNYEILHERDDDDTERPDKRGVASTETSTEFMQRFLRLAEFLGAAAGTEEEQAKNFQWGLRRSHGHQNDRHGSDRRGGNDNHRGSNNNNNYSSSNNRNFGNGRDQRNRGHQSSRSTNSSNSS